MTVQCWSRRHTVSNMLCIHLVHSFSSRPLLPTPYFLQNNSELHFLSSRMVLLFLLLTMTVGVFPEESGHHLAPKTLEIEPRRPVIPIVLVPEPPIARSVLYIPCFFRMPSHNPATGRLVAEPRLWRYVHVHIGYRCVRKRVVGHCFYHCETLLLGIEWPCTTST